MAGAALKSPPGRPATTAHRLTIWSKQLGHEHSDPALQSGNHGSGNTDYAQLAGDSSAAVIIKNVRAHVIGPIFAGMESRASLAGIFKGGFYDPRNLPPDFIDELVKGGKRQGYSDVARAAYRALPSYVAARSYYARIDVSVTLVYGDHDWSRSAEREANRALIKRAKIILLKDTRHIVSLERPEEFARILIESQATGRAAACAEQR